MNHKIKTFLWVWVLLFSIASVSFISLLLVIFSLGDLSCIWFHTLSKQLDNYIRVTIERSYSPDIVPPCAGYTHIWYPDVIFGILLFLAILSLFVIRKNSYFKSLSSKEVIWIIFLSILGAIIIGSIFIFFLTNF